MKKTILLLAVLILVSSVVFSGFKESTDSWGLLREMIGIHGVSGYEELVADYIQKKLPSGLDVRRDDMHNVWFTVGEGTPHLMFVAHTDELGLVVTGVTDKGRLKVEGKGGFFPQTYEGQPVVVRTDTGLVNGIVEPREGYFQRQVQKAAPGFDGFSVYVGAHTAEEVEKLGIKTGDSITIQKTLVDLNENLLCTRAVDDRAGCAALLAAALSIDWSSVQGKTVTFAWDVQEETGLFGARHLARSIHPDYIFPVDTFVSSDGPFDDKRFALTPLGQGPVIRAIDSSNLAPALEVNKIIDLANRMGIPYQLGNTKGGNDGSVFVAGGAVNIPLSWPGTYSHSFIEKINRLDLEALTALLVAIVKEFCGII
ncbi:MAG: M20/M25/M40 family metallo-hydrolase [Candidatus Aminicenantes bacterium]|nr:M20/M25/M40 family metallo-hydrolase [Candidatus Aminicenantes bacterium]